MREYGGCMMKRLENHANRPYVISADGTASPTFAVLLVVQGAFAATSSPMMFGGVGCWAMAGRTIPHEHACSSGRFKDIIDTLDF